MKATDVFPPDIHDALKEVERRLASAARSRDETLDGWSQEPIAAGGKRIRPILLLTTIRAFGQPLDDKALDAATAIELVHTASLVHDDLMDDAAERRGKPSTYAAHGQDAAILVGDYLFTQAFGLAATLPKGAMELTADACRRLCEGQVREQTLLARGEPDRAMYQAVIRDKTASLLAAACGIGASIAGQDDAAVEALYRYGNAVGHAFQILDDLLDVTGDPQWTGKPAGTDYLAGTVSSPYLNLLDRGEKLPKQRRNEDFPDIRNKLLDSGAVAESQLEASNYTQAAFLALKDVPDSPHKQALSNLAEYLMERAQ